MKRILDLPCRVVLLWFILFLLCCFWPPESARASVGLVYFTATSLSSSVRLDWETATEPSTGGFYLKRSLSETEDFEAINGFFVSQGSASTGAEYSYTDSTVSIGETYYYQLISVATDQSQTTYGPVSVFVGLQETSTATEVGAPTGTATETPTATATGSSATPTNTATEDPSVTWTPSPSATDAGTLTVTPTGTPATPGAATPTGTPAFLSSPTPTSTSVGVATSTSQPIGTPTATQTGGAAFGTPSVTPPITTTQALTMTATFLPVPTITIQFPTATIARKVQAVTRDPGSPGLTKARPRVALTRFAPLALIVLIWALLGGWFYTSMRRLD